MRNAALHRLLETFTVDASGRLAAEAARGAEVPFELAEEQSPGGIGRQTLYVYRPLIGEFIRSHAAALAELPSYGPALAAVADTDGTREYLSGRAESKIPGDARRRAARAMVAFLESVFAQRSEFGFEPAHFEAAYAELERALYHRAGMATVIVPVLGIALDGDTIELAVGDGVSLIRGEALADAPAQAIWGDGEEPQVLAMLTIDDERSDRSPISVARTRFRRIISALRLFQRGAYALGPVAWSRAETATWRAVALGGGRTGGVRFLTLIAAAQHEELRAFYRLVSRRPRGGGELAWALARFEMGCERLAAFEALTDYLLALRALLEPEGPASGRLAQRLAIICATPDGRAALARRVARAISLERAVITGMAAEPAPADVHPLLAGAVSSDHGATSINALVDELAEHLRALLRDALCGHLDADLCRVADDLIAEAADAAEAEVG